MSTTAPPAGKKKGADIHVLRCLDPQCRGMLAYEVSSANVLYVDLAWTAHRDGDTRYFPCPKCGGRNVVEEMRDAKGAVRHEVTRFEPAPQEHMSDRDGDLDLMPRIVRDKLDRAGVKLHLREWQLLTLEERRALCDRPCDSADEIERYRTDLEALVLARTGLPPDRLPEPR